jgi:pyruvate,water dikinase
MEKNPDRLRERPLSPRRPEENGPAGLAREILEAFRARGLDKTPVAVRSSAIQEDADDAAFAGAAESYLFVKPEELLGKIVENWASFWLPRGIRYRRRHGLPSSELRPATLIQTMSPAEVSGVIFTRNPVDSADEVVINAAYGLGEGVVSGVADADSYAARKSDGEEVLLPHVARKRWQVLENGLAPVPKPLRGKRVLTRDQTRRLAAVACAIERRFGRPMDVEFSIHEGRIVVLQARPITTL